MADRMTGSIPASIEVSARHVLDGKLTVTMLPLATRVYVTDVGVDPVEDIVLACRSITDMGYRPVPHVPARRIESEGALDRRLGALRSQAGVDDILVIAGEADRTMGPYEETMAILESGLVERHGFADVAVGGHPEGNPAYMGREPMGVLRAKVARAQAIGRRARIVTQFGFDGPRFVEWAHQVAESGIDAPIHLGVAGPAKVMTLMKYAAMCGVGNSLNFFKKRTSAIAHLATRHSPEEVVAPIEAAWRAGEGNIAQIHVFPFGGLGSSSDWLRERGSFPAPAQPIGVIATSA